MYRAGASLAVRDARTLALRQRLPIGPPFVQELTADVPDGSILIAPDGHTVYYGYWMTNSDGQPAQAYLARWSLPSGRRLPTVALGPGPLLAASLVAHGTRLVLVTGHTVETYQVKHAPADHARSRYSPRAGVPSAAVISPDGSTVAIGSQSGAVSFVDAAGGTARRARGGHSTAVASLADAPTAGPHSRWATTEG